MTDSPRTPRVLILEDEKSIARLCSRVIQALGAKTDVAGTVSEAEALIRGGRYDLLVCDMRLPDGAGLDVEGLHREHNPPGRIIVMTGSLTPGHLSLTQARGQFAVLSKPFELEDFRAAVTEILGSFAAAGGAE